MMYFDVFNRKYCARFDIFFHKHLIRISFSFCIFRVDGTHIFAKHDEEEQRSHRGDFVRLEPLRPSKTVSVHGQQMGS